MASVQLNKNIVQLVLSQAQRAVVNGVISGCQPVTSRVPQGSISGPVPFTVFVNDLDAKLECIQSLFVDSAKLGRRAVSLKGREALQRDDDQLRVNSSTRTSSGFGTCERATWIYVQTGVGLERSPAEGDLGILVKKNLHMSQQHALAA